MPELNQAYFNAVPELDSSYDVGDAPGVHYGEVVEGNITRGTGLIPRDYESRPSGCMAAAPSFPDSFLLSDAECKERIAENIATKATLLDVREANYDVLQSLNQGSYSLCWNFSTTKAVMYVLAVQGTPMVLSPWFNAGLIKGWRDQGGWGLESLEYAVNHGIPKMELCPDYSRSYDTPATRADAALRKVLEWWDGGDDPERNWQIRKTCNALNIPCVCDYNRIRHSMCGPFVLPDLSGSMDDNSWSPNSGEKGMYRQMGRNARPNGIVVPRVGKFAR
jgi:hypothetical protein